MDDPTSHISIFKAWYSSKPRFWLSTAALVLGWMMFFSGLGRYAEEPLQVAVRVAPRWFHTTFSGIIIIPGVLAYRSAKRRRHNLRKNTWYRKTAESVAIGFISIISLNIVIKAPSLLVEHPVAYAIIPALVISTYIGAWHGGRNPLPKI